MVRRALVPEFAAGWQRVMDDEALGVRENRAQRKGRKAALDRAVELTRQIGHGQMQAPIRCIRARRDRGRIGGPHGGGGRDVRDQQGRGLPGLRDDRRVRTGKAEAPQTSTWGRSCGGNTPCGTPSSIKRRIFASPCRAAARGFETRPRLSIDLMLPSERPPKLWVGPTNPSKLTSSASPFLGPDMVRPFALAGEGRQRRAVRLLQGVDLHRDRHKLAIGARDRHLAFAQKRGDLVALPVLRDVEKVAAAEPLRGCARPGGAIGAKLCQQARVLRQGLKTGLQGPMRGSRDFAERSP